MNFQTERLLIRPVSITDKDCMFGFRSDPGTSKYLSLVPSSVDEVAVFINKSSPEINVPGTWFQFVIIERLNNQLIGDIGIPFLDTVP